MTKLLKQIISICFGDATTARIESATLTFVETKKQEFETEE